MITLGIDLASQPDHTAACLIRWGRGGARVEESLLSCDDRQLDELIARTDAIGIDAPLGWPAEFAAAVADWRHDAWTIDLRQKLRFRVTDLMVAKRLGRTPLSVSTDLIALPAMRAMALLRRHRTADRIGARGRFFEVYPAASLHAWGLPDRGYKDVEGLSRRLRRRMLAKINRRFSTDASPRIADSSDVFDALVASITARMAATGKTNRPSASQLPTIRREGWIHVPRE